eukprot:2271843-Rhodomonas_salina.3
MASFIKDHDFVNEFLFAAPTPATYNERSYPGDLFWLLPSQARTPRGSAVLPGCPVRGPGLKGLDQLH